MGLTNWLTGNTTTTTTSSNVTFSSNWLTSSASTLLLGNLSNWSGFVGQGGYSYTQPESLDETQVKSLKHILTLASASDEELVDIADSLAASTGDTPAEALKVLRTVRALVLLGQLTEKLAR